MVAVPLAEPDSRQPGPGASRSGVMPCSPLPGPGPSRAPKALAQSPGCRDAASPCSPSRCSRSPFRARPCRRRPRVPRPRRCSRRRSSRSTLPAGACWQPGAESTRRPIASLTKVMTALPRDRAWQPRAHASVVTPRGDATSRPYQRRVSSPAAAYTARDAALVGAARSRATTPPRPSRSTPAAARSRASTRSRTRGRSALGMTLDDVRERVGPRRRAEPLDRARPGAARAGRAAEPAPSRRSSATRTYRTKWAAADLRQGVGEPQQDARDDARARTESRRGWTTKARRLPGRSPQRAERPRRDRRRARLAEHLVGHGGAARRGVQPARLIRLT